jgi:hypothetical protein
MSENITTPNITTNPNIKIINDIIEKNDTLKRCEKHDFTKIFNVITQLKEIKVEKRKTPIVTPEPTLPVPPPSQDVGYINKFNSIISKIYTSMDTYNSIYDNYKYLVDLDNIYVNKAKEFDGYAKKAYVMGLTDNRKTYYSNESIERVQFYYRILYFIYIVLMLSFLLKLLWRLNPEMPFLNKVFFFVLFIILPFIANTVYYMIVVLIKYIQSFFPTAQNPVK